MIGDKTLWNLYILYLDNHGIKTNVGLITGYYTGISENVGKRLGDHLFKRGINSYINTIWPGATKIPVYIEYFYGTKSEMMQREKQVKRLSVVKKQELINSHNNMLVGYYPLKHIILKNNKLDGEIVIKII